MVVIESHERIVLDTDAYQIAVNPQYLAVETQPGQVFVYFLTDLTAEPFSLSTDGTDVSCMGFGPLEGANGMVGLLAVCSQEALFLFDLVAAQTGEETAGRPIGRGLLGDIGPSQSVRFLQDYGIAVCAGLHVYVYSLVTDQLAVQLDGHSAPVNAALETAPGHLLTCSDDRSLKLWDLDAGNVVYQSGILGAAGLEHVALDLAREQVILGANDGILRVLSMNDGYREAEKIDLSRRLLVYNAAKGESDGQRETATSGHKIIDSRAGRPRDCMQGATPPVPVDTGELVTILDMGIIPDDPENGVVAKLVVVTTTDIVTLSCATFDIDMVLPHETLFASLQAHNASVDDVADVEIALPEVHQGSIIWDATDNLLIAALSEGYTEDPAISLLYLQPTSYREDTGAEDGDRVDVSRQWSMLLQGPPPPGSILASKPAASTASSSRTGKGKGKGKGRTTGSTRGRGSTRGKGSAPSRRGPKVRSSGYGSTRPVMKMFSGAKKVANKTTRTRERDGTANQLGGEVVEYPVHCGLLEHEQVRNAIASGTGAPVATCAFSPTGKTLATGRNDGTIGIHRLPVSKHGSGQVLNGHNLAVTGLSWSSSSKYLLSSSKDNTAELWVMGRSKPLLKFDHGESSVTGSSSTPGSKKDNLKFSDPVIDASFYYMDKFVSLASGPVLGVYQYKLADLSDIDDIRRLRNPSKYRCALRFQVPSQSITAVACHTSVLSPYITLACSDKTIQVYDVCAQQDAISFATGHARAPHALALSATSQFVTPSSESFNMIASASTKDIRLFDLRSPTDAVAKYSQHGSSQIPISCAISPCLRYLTTGSGDRQMYIYELRTGLLLSKPTVPGMDVVSAVDYNPRYPQVAVCSATSADVSFFTDEPGVSQ